MSDFSCFSFPFCLFIIIFYVPQSDAKVYFIWYFTHSIFVILCGYLTHHVAAYLPLVLTLAIFRRRRRGFRGGGYRNGSWFFGRTIFSSYNLFDQVWDTQRYVILNFLLYVLCHVWVKIPQSHSAWGWQLYLCLLQFF